jgi:glycosyltransferase involved in cell wall biosynthesis
MKILQITTSINGGAGIAALRLHKALCENNVSSGFLSTDLSLDFNNELLEDEFFNYIKKTLIKRIINKIKRFLIPSYKFNKTKQFEGLKNKLSCEIATLPFSNYQLHNHPLVKEADVINLHWVSGVLDYPSFFKSCKKPIVWTLHDMNPFQGVFHYKDDQRRNENIIGDFDFEIKKIKKKSLKLIKKGAIISPSNWLLDKASDNFSAFSKTCISNSIDLNVFTLKNKLELRKNFAILPDEFVLFFVADSLKNPRKGFDLLLESLSILSKIMPITIMVIGEGNIPKMNNIKVLSLGVVKSEIEMSNLYSVANVFVLPTREDNLPNVMLESFACGLPVISFNNGGMVEHIKLNFNGLLIDGFTGVALADGILDFYKSRNNYNSFEIRKYAENNFSFKKQAEAYSDIYEEILS